MAGRDAHGGHCKGDRNSFPIRSTVEEVPDSVAVMAPRVEMRPPWSWGRRPLKIAPLAGEADPGAPPCIVHLVRAANGIDSLREFVAAMRARPPGVEHELVLAMKGFASPAAAAPYLEVAADLAPRVEFFADRGLDLGLLFAAAARLRRDRYCFINSHTRPFVDGWLAKLDAALAPADVGIVGATGSWASTHSWMTYSLGLPSFYRGVLPPVRVMREQLRAIDSEQPGVGRPSRTSALRTRLGLLAQLPEELWGREPFPVPHLRNTALMLTHETLSAMRLFGIRNKMDTYALESGPHRFTCQVEQMGLRALVVDSAGRGYEPCDWHRSRTYCQGAQEGLLAIDNRTRSYDHGDALRRRVLAGLAWGDRAEPELPGGVS